MCLPVNKDNSKEEPNAIDEPMGPMGIRVEGGERQHENLGAAIECGCPT